MKIWGFGVGVIEVDEFWLEGFALSSFSQAAAYDEAFGACNVDDPGNLFSCKEFEALDNIF